MSQFIDYAQIEIASGDGGNGLIGWRREKYEPNGGPAGGNGGRGGSIYLEATNDLSTLSEFKYQNKFAAQNGDRGGGSKRDGKSGKDLILKVPIGTVIKDAQSNQVIADLEHDHDRVLVAAGGRGGRGNAAFATPTLRAPYFCEPGESGIKRTLILELKLLADVGLIGLPNAGKSTLLAALTRAKPKIADYPFSTLEPNLGTVVSDHRQSFVIADIPGLIAGASQGAGLGHNFLRHIERTLILVHLVDTTSENPIADIQTIDKELKDFNDDLFAKEQIIAINKMDLLTKDETIAIEEQLRKAFPQKTMIAISGLTRAGTKDLLTLLEQRLSNRSTELAQSLSTEDADTQAEPKGRTWTADDKATDRSNNDFQVSRIKGGFCIYGDRILKHAQVVDPKSPESIHHFAKIMRSMGVIDELNKLKIEIGDRIQIGPMIYSYGEDLY